MRRGSRARAALRVCLDANIWVSFLMRAQAARTQPSAITRLLKTLYDMDSGAMPIQLVVSYELIDTISRVLKREGFSGAVVEEPPDAVRKRYARNG